MFHRPWHDETLHFVLKEEVNDEWPRSTELCWGLSVTHELTQNWNVSCILLVTIVVDCISKHAKQKAVGPCWVFFQDTENRKLLRVSTYLNLTHSSRIRKQLRGSVSGRLWCHTTCKLAQLKHSQCYSTNAPWDSYCNRQRKTEQKKQSRQSDANMTPTLKFYTGSQLTFTEASFSFQLSICFSDSAPSADESSFSFLEKTIFSRLLMMAIALSGWDVQR